MGITGYTFAGKIALSPEDTFDDNANGRFGYRVFYQIPKEVLLWIYSFVPVNKDCTEGEIEFTVDADGRQTGQVLVWQTVREADGNLSNYDFIQYYGNISCLVDDFANNHR